MRWLLLALVGCASGGRSDVAVDASGADTQQITIDSAPPVDGRTTMTLSQTQTAVLEPLWGIACPASGGTAANSYYRVFDLSAFGISTDFTVTQVSFQVEHCDQTNGSGGATVAVRVGTYDDTPGDSLALASMTILASNPTVMIPEIIEDVGPPPTTPGGTVNAPITATIPAGQKLLVGVDAPDGTNSYYFYMAANDDGESAPAYISAPSCNVTVPTNINTVTDPQRPVHLLLTVTGTY